jgi:SAM-dependent methyltransferase
MKSRGLWSVSRRLGNVVDKIRDESGGKKDYVVLEVGCGFGKAIQEMKKELPGIRFIGMNRKPYHEQIPGHEYIYGDCGERIPVSDASVDFLYSISTLQFVHNRARFFEEASRVLKDGGHMRVQLPEFRPEFGKWMSMDVILEDSGETTLWRHLQRFPGYDVFSGQQYSLLAIRKKAGSQPLVLGLEFLPEQSMDYGVLKKARMGEFRNVYRHVSAG